MKLFIALTAVMSLGLSACGSDSAPPSLFVTGTDVPLTAVASSTGAAVFIKEVVATPIDIAEKAEPLELGDAVLATSDSDEPDPDV
jgi:uncharacterized lipoprotein YmbA